jgi:hypothetical protein
VLTLLQEFQAQTGAAFLFVAHNLAVVRNFCDRVAVMYLGKIVEIAARDRLYADPQHPYTQALLSPAPVPSPRLERARQRIVLQGDPRQIRPQAVDSALAAGRPRTYVPLLSRHWGTTPPRMPSPAIFQDDRTATLAEDRAVGGWTSASRPGCRNVIRLQPSPMASTSLYLSTFTFPALLRGDVNS